ncbi:YutD family protein [Paenibacillus sp. FSL E2-0202]|uniref:YutD family protein n=2 Tax=unclassified Paenibacillus TaxID=185978 RepID=UPI0030EEFCEB
MIVIGGKGYELMLDHKDGWNPEAFRGRYSEVLERYDYIIGDWGYSQLRLKGFYRDNHPKVNRDTAISGMVDYINEYCNFGCAYFVLHKLKEVPQEGMFKDILIKEIPEPSDEEALEQEGEASDEAAADKEFSVKETSSKQGSNHSLAFKEMTSSKDNMVKDRPVREHQSRNHRGKDSQGKKSKKDFQGRPPQGQSQKPQNTPKPQSAQNNQNNQNIENSQP